MVRRRLYQSLYSIALSLGRGLTLSVDTPEWEVTPSGWAAALCPVAVAALTNTAIAKPAPVNRFPAAFIGAPRTDIYAINTAPIHFPGQSGILPALLDPGGQYF